MSRYTTQILPTLDWLLMQPGTDMARWATLGITILAGTLVLLLTGQAFRFEKCTLGLCLIAVLIAWILAIAIVAAVRVHLPEYATLMIWSGLALVGLVLSVAGICGLMQVNYWTAILPWCASMAAMIAVILLAQATVRSADTGMRQTDGMQQRHMQLREFDGD